MTDADLNLLCDLANGIVARLHLIDLRSEPMDHAQLIAGSHSDALELLATLQRIKSDRTAVSPPDHKTPATPAEQTAVA